MFYEFHQYFFPSQVYPDSLVLVPNIRDRYTARTKVPQRLYTMMPVQDHPRFSINNHWSLHEPIRQKRFLNLPQAHTVNPLMTNERTDKN